VHFFLPENLDLLSQKLLSFFLSFFTTFLPAEPQLSAQILNIAATDLSPPYMQSHPFILALYYQ
jgi:hypothetical protein